MRWEAVGLRERGESRRSRKFYPATDLSISTKPRMMNDNGAEQSAPGRQPATAAGPACGDGLKSIRCSIQSAALRANRLSRCKSRRRGRQGLRRWVERMPSMLPVLPTNGVDSTARTPASSTTSKAGVPKKIGLSATSSTMICARVLNAVPHTACPSWTQSKNSRKG